MSNEFDDPFARRRTRWWSFGRGAVPGQTGIRGTILEIGSRQQSTKWNPNPNAPKELDWWDKEQTRPKEYVPLTLQTDLNEPNADFPEDDGVRSIAVDIQYKPGGKMNAIQEAVKAAGGKTIQVGGKLALWFTGVDPESDNPDNPRKLYAAKYELPVGSGAAAFGAQEPPQQQPQYGGPGTTAYTNAGQQGGYPAPQQAPPNQFQAQHGAPHQSPYGGSAQDFARAAANPGPPTVAAPAPQAAPAPISPDEVKARLAAGQTDGQISAETGAPLETIAAIRNFAALQGTSLGAPQPQQTFPPSSGPDAADPPF